MASHVFNNAGMLLHFLRELNMNLSWDTTSVWILALEPILSAQCNLESVSFTQAVIKTQPWLDAYSLREAGYCLALSLWNTSTFSLYGPVCFCAGGVDGWAVEESWYKSWQQLRSLRYLVFIVVYKNVLMGFLKLLLTSPHTEMTLVEMFVCWELECSMGSQFCTPGGISHKTAYPRSLSTASTKQNSHQGKPLKNFCWVLGSLGSVALKSIINYILNSVIGLIY